MRRPTTAGLAMALAITWAAPALAQEGSGASQLPACPPGEDALLTFQPDFVRKGQQSAAFRITETESSELAQIASARVTVAGKTTFFTYDPEVDDEARAIVPITPSGKALDVVFDWLQNLGTSEACRGRDRASVPVIGADDKAGDPYSPRIAGVYSIRYSTKTKAKPPTPSTWTIRPQCDVFACTSRLDSTGGASGLLRLVKEGGFYRYRQPNQGTSGSCTITSVATGERRTIKPAYRVSATITLRKVSTRNGIADRVRGLITYDYVVTPRAEAAGCGQNGDGSQSFTITGRRR